jgi:hypothetical protein
LDSDIKGGTQTESVWLRLLRRIFGLKTHEATGGWRELHYEKLHNFCSSPSKIRMIKSRKMRWAGHVAHVGEKRYAYMIYGLKA